MTVKQKSIHGRQAYITDDNVLVGKGGIGAGEDGVHIDMPGNPDKAVIWEDFLGDPLKGIGVGDTAGVPTVSDTGSAGLFFIRKTGGTGITTGLAAATNGVYRFTTTTAGTKTVAGGSKIISPQLAWKVNQGAGAGAGRLRMSARVKKSTYTGGEHGIFVGFTDVVNSEMPFHDTGGTADKVTASNGFGIMWNVSGDTGWVGVAVDGDTYQEDVLDATAPTDNVWVKLQMEATRGASDTGGRVSFFVDGKLLGEINNPCNVSTALAPCIAIYDTGGAANVDVDYIGVSAPRDTGT